MASRRLAFIRVPATESTAGLMAAGTKASQQRDIEKAKARWKDYKERKQRGE